MKYLFDLKVAAILNEKAVIDDPYWMREYDDGDEATHPSVISAFYSDNSLLDSPVIVIVATSAYRLDPVNLNGMFQFLISHLQMLKTSLIGLELMKSLMIQEKTWALKLALKKLVHSSWI